MNMHRLKTIAFAVACIGTLVGAAQANSVDAVLKVSQSTNSAAKESQTRIDGLAKETDALLQDYRTVMKQVDGLRVYNERLEKQIQNQVRRINDIEESIQQVTVIQRQVLPLVVKMVAALEEFVAADVPFLAEERAERIAFLKRNIDRSDLSVAEKFRQVLEAYKIENEYGRKVESYKGQVEIGGVEREVNFFRVGRIALMYQTTDAQDSGVWDSAAGQFVALNAGDYRNAIQKGLRIARKQASIDILKLPVPAPEAL